MPTGAIVALVFILLISIATTVTSGVAYFSAKKDNPSSTDMNNVKRASEVTFIASSILMGITALILVFRKHVFAAAYAIASVH